MDETNIKNGNDLKREYFTGFNPEFWMVRSEKLIFALNSDDEEYKNDAVFELYSLYLQAIEVFFINQFSTKENNDNFIKSIFIANDPLRQKITSHQRKGFPDVRSMFTDILRPLYIESLGNGSEADTPVDKYMPIFYEVAKDYLQDYDLLNAYKHGFRVQYKDEEASLYIGAGGVRSKVSTTDFRIEYITKKTDKARSQQVIFMPMIAFNKYRLIEKTRFITKMIANQVALKQHGYLNPTPENITLYFFEFEDELKWKESFGNLRFNKPILRGPIN